MPVQYVSTSFLFKCAHVGRSPSLSSEFIRAHRARLGQQEAASLQWRCSARRVGCGPAGPSCGRAAGPSLWRRPRRPRWWKSRCRWCSPARRCSGWDRAAAAPQRRPSGPVARNGTCTEHWGGHEKQKQWRMMLMSQCLIFIFPKTLLRVSRDFPYFSFFIFLLGFSICNSIHSLLNLVSISHNTNTNLSVFLEYYRF